MSLWFKAASRYITGTSKSSISRIRFSLQTTPRTAIWVAIESPPLRQRQTEPHCHRTTTASQTMVTVRKPVGLWWGSKIWLTDMHPSAQYCEALCAIIAHELHVTRMNDRTGSEALPSPGHARSRIASSFRRRLPGYLRTIGEIPRTGVQT